MFFLSQLLALFSHLYPEIFVLCKTKIWLTVVNLRTLKSVWETIPEEEMVTKNYHSLLMIVNILGPFLNSDTVITKVHT